MNTSGFFAHYYNNAEVNAIMIMDLDGNVLDVNRAFTANFGYSNDDIRKSNASVINIWSITCRDSPDTSEVIRLIFVSQATKKIFSPGMHLKNYCTCIMFNSLSRMLLNNHFRRLIVQSKDWMFQFP